MAQQNLSKTQDKIRLEIQTAHYNYKQAIDKVELTESSLSKASESEQMAMKRYKEGNVSIVEVINAQLYHQQYTIQTKRTDGEDGFRTGNLLSSQKRIGHERNIIREIGMYPFVFGIRGLFLFLAVISYGATRAHPRYKDLIDRFVHHDSGIQLVRFQFTGQQPLDGYQLSIILYQ